VGVEHDQVDIPIVRGDLGDNSCNHIIRSISFNNNQIIRVEMCQDRCLGNGVFEGPERLDVVRAPYERSVLASKMNKGITMSENPTMNQQ